MKAKDEIVEVMEKILKDILSEKFPVATVTEVGGKIRTLSSKNTKTRRSFGKTFSFKPIHHIVYKSFM